MPWCVRYATDRLRNREGFLLDLSRRLLLFVVVREKRSRQCRRKKQPRKGKSIIKRYLRGRL